ncbi:hypothetical protein HAV21_03545 [Paenarthrobacter sp. MSM-2-10-13]|uniref:hypothetical protein n=1 Tax=Paenarthrobacter sp. MSM-2-10-13 TaxID=2717318 RepID=UPI0014241565|nr:hypothetical protein [Paenarthrobacter sp. MSM-2-10-13]NHW45972.1 hypothetical protein [Paenarthrobacter sp. MSM-2-10-13]
MASIFIRKDYMGLNIVATRKYSLKGFAQGWDDCFVIVKAANESQRRSYADGLMTKRAEMQQAIAEQDNAKIQALGSELDAAAEEAVKEFALELIQSGMVMSTNDEGVAELVAFEKSDAPKVIEALGFAWLNDIVGVATGTDRLKAKTN